MNFLFRSVFFAFIFVVFFGVYPAEAAKIRYTFIGNQGGTGSALTDAHDKCSGGKAKCGGQCCAPGEDCDGGVCKNKCLGNEVWDGSKCVGCLDGSYCAIDEQCVNDYCEPRCVFPAVWSVLLDMCVACLSDSQCPADKFCNAAGSCEPRCEFWDWDALICVDCLVDADCGDSALWCSDGSCITRCESPFIWNGAACVACLNDSQCPPDEFCNAAGTCEDRCVSPAIWNGTTCVECLNDSYCPLDRFCNAGGTCEFRCISPRIWRQAGGVWGCNCPNDGDTYDSAANVCCGVGSAWASDSNPSVGACCPIGGAYIDWYGCVECWDDSFCPCNLATYTCCPTGEYVTPEDVCCPVGQTSEGGICGCFGVKTEWDSATKQCGCPTDKPVDTGSACIGECRPDQVWDDVIKACVCPDSRDLNLVSNTCCPETEPMWSYNNTTLNGSCCPVDQIWNGAECTVECPAESIIPEMFGGGCCPPDAKWFYGGTFSGEWKCCPDNTYWSTITDDYDEITSGECCPTEATWNGTECITSACPDRDTQGNVDYMTGEALPNNCCPENTHWSYDHNNQAGACCPRDWYFGAYGEIGCCPPERAIPDEEARGAMGLSCCWEGTKWSDKYTDCLEDGYCFVDNDCPINHSCTQGKCCNPAGPFDIFYAEITGVVVPFSCDMLYAVMSRRCNIYTFSFDSKEYYSLGKCYMPHPSICCSIQDRSFKGGVKMTVEGWGWHQETPEEFLTRLGIPLD